MHIHAHAHRSYITMPSLEIIVARADKLWPASATDRIKYDGGPPDPTGGDPPFRSRFQPSRCGALIFLPKKGIPWAFSSGFADTPRDFPRHAYLQRIGVTHDREHIVCACTWEFRTHRRMFSCVTAAYAAEAAESLGRDAWTDVVTGMFAAVWE